MREYIGPASHVYEVAFIPGASPRLAAASHSAVYTWALDSNEPWKAEWTENAWGVPVLEISPDGKWLIAGPTEHLRGWDVSRPAAKAPVDLACHGLILLKFAEPTNRLHVLVQSELNGGHLLEVDRWRLPSATATRERRTVGWPADMEPPLGSFNSATARHTNAISVDGRRLAVTARKAVHIWDLAAARLLGTLRLKNNPDAVALSPDATKLALDGGTTVYVYDVASLTLIAKWKINHAYSPRLAWSPDGCLLARVERSTTVRVYDAASGRQELAVGTKRGILLSTAFAPDGLTLATGGMDGCVRVWDLE